MHKRIVNGKLRTSFILVITFVFSPLCFQLGCTSSDDKDTDDTLPNGTNGDSTSSDASTSDNEWTNDVPYRGVIIKSAGHLPGTERPEGVDVVSIATTEISNTHSLSDKLVEELNALNVTTSIVESYNCEELQCVFDSSGEGGSSELADLIVFASPIWGAELLFQVRKMIPKLPGVVDQENKVLFSVLSSAGEPEASGQEGVDSFVESLKSEGYQTVSGKVVAFDAGVEEIDEAIVEFSHRLVKGIKEL